MTLKEIKGSGHAELGGVSVSVRGVRPLCEYLNSLGDIHLRNYVDLSGLPTWGPAPRNTLEIWSWEWVSDSLVKALVSASGEGFEIETIERGDGSLLAGLFFTPATVGAAE